MPLRFGLDPREEERRRYWPTGQDVPEVDPPEKLLPEDQGAFTSFLNWIGRPNQMIKNLATGDIGGAARQGADFFGDIIDVLPGDLIPEASRPEDYKTGLDVLRVDKQWQKDHPVMGFLGSLPVDILTDPLTLTGLGPIAKGAGAIGKVAAKGVSALPHGAEALAAGGKLAKEAEHWTHKTFAAMKPTEEIAAAEREAVATGGATRQAAQSFPVEAFAGTDPEVQRRAVEMIRGVTSEGIGPSGYTDLGKTGEKFVNQGEQRLLINRRIAAMPWDEATKQAVRDEAFKASDYAQTMWRQGVRDKVYSHPADVPLDKTPADYFPGKYDLEDEAGLIPGEARPSGPSITKAKSYTNPQELAEGLTATGGKLDTNIPQVLGEYGEQMGRAVQSATMGRKVAGEGYKALTDPASRKLVEDLATGLREAGDLDSAHVIETTIKGIPKPGALVGTLMKLNKPFKAAATGGILVPRLNFTVGNVTSSVWQAFSNKESRAQTWETAKRVIPTIFGSIGDGLKQLGVHSIPDSDAAIVANAARKSGGSREKMLELIDDPDLKAAVQHGVLDGGFVNSEQMMANASERLRGAKSLQNWLYWPQAIAKGSEQRMRYGIFKDLKKAGKPDAEAARIANETLLNYNMVSAENRAARSGLPFFQFVAKTIPQQAKLLGEKSLAGSFTRNALRGSLTGQDDPVYPWMEGKLNIPVGADEEGNNQYLSSLRLPFEALGQIPNISASPRTFGRQAEQSIGGSAHPLLKTAYSYFSGEDPFFDSPVGSYSKLPGNIEAGDAGRAYNQLAGTGMIQPLASLAQTAGKFADDRTSPAEKAINILTGAKIQSVDADRALQQKLTDYLQRHPEVKSFESLYTKSDSPEVQALLRELQAAKKRIKDKRAVK